MPVANVPPPRRQSSWWLMDFTRLFIRRRAGRAGWLASMRITLARSADEPAHEAIIGIQARLPGCGLPGSAMARRCDPVDRRPRSWISGRETIEVGSNADLERGSCDWISEGLRYTVSMESLSLEGWIGLEILLNHSPLFGVMNGLCESPSLTLPYTYLPAL